MSSQPLAAVPAGRFRQVRLARTLSILTIAWMTVEAAVATIAAAAAGSVVVLGFGLDSLIELLSASMILWLYTGSRNGSGRAGRRAQQIVGAAFAALALYLSFDAIRTLAHSEHPATGWLGVAVSAGAIVVMPSLARAKGRVGRAAGVVLIRLLVLRLQGLPSERAPGMAGRELRRLQAVKSELRAPGAITWPDTRSA